ncbi:uncharacterized protein ACOB8E_011309 isoform 3-T3 [Sarcophilus harrisii]
MRGHCGDLLFASSQDVPSPAPHNLAVTERRELRGCFEREAAFYLRYSNSSEIPLSTSLEGQAGLSLQVLSGNASKFHGEALPEGFNLEPRARPFSILSENPAEKLPSKIIVPRTRGCRWGEAGSGPQRRWKGEALEVQQEGPEEGEERRAAGASPRALADLSASPRRL